MSGGTRTVPPDAGRGNKLKEKELIVANNYTTDDAGNTPAGIPPGRFDPSGAILEMADECGWSESTVLDMILDFLADGAAAAPGFPARLLARLRAIHDD